MHSLLISLPLFPSLTRSCQNPFLLNAGLPISCLHPNTKHSLIKIWKLARCIHFKFRATELRRSSALPNNPSIFSWSLYSHFNSLIPPFSHQSFNNCHLPLSWFLILFPWQNRSQQKKTSTSSLFIWITLFFFLNLSAENKTLIPISCVINFWSLISCPWLLCRAIIRPIPFVTLQLNG